jgi:hypothetical protein
MKNRSRTAPTKENVQMKSEKILKIAAPIGDNPPDDIDLKERIAKLGNNAPITTIFQEISKWEDDVVIDDRQYENTNLTGRLTTTCR